MTFSDINRFVNSRGMVALVGSLMLVAARYAFQTGAVTYYEANAGLLFASANLWISDHWLTMVVSTASVLIVSLTWMLIIQVFNPYRAFTTLGTSFFMVMMTATPDVLDRVNTGTLLVGAMPACVALLWTSFGNHGRMRHVFLLFAILSALTMTQYCFVLYIPVFLIGCIQMKIFSLRTVLAAIFGLVTPWWIVFGLGLADLEDLRLPDFSTFFTAMDFGRSMQLVAVVLFTTLLAVGAWFGNVMKVISLNVNLRAFNGSLSLITLATIVVVFIDFTNAMAYLPTLYLMTAYQLSIMLGKNDSSHRFIPVLLIIAVYYGLFAWAVV